MFVFVLKLNGNRNKERNSESSVSCSEGRKNVEETKWWERASSSRQIL